MILLWLFFHTVFAGPSLPSDGEETKIPIEDQFFIVGPENFRLSILLTKIFLSDIATDTKHSSLKFTTSDTIVANFTSITGKIQFQWQYENELGSDYGDCEVFLEKLDLYSSLTVTNNADGKEQVTVDQLDIKLVSYDVTFSNNPYAPSSNWLFLYLNDTVKELVDDQLSKQVATILEERINSALLKSDMSLRTIILLIRAFLGLKGR